MQLKINHKAPKKYIISRALIKEYRTYSILLGSDMQAEEEEKAHGTSKNKEWIVCLNGPIFPDKFVDPRPCSI
jgi:hypothetical protein